MRPLGWFLLLFLLSAYGSGVQPVATVSLSDLAPLPPLDVVPLRVAVAEVSARIFLMMTLVSALGVLRTVTLTFILTYPLGELAEATRHAAGSDFSPRVRAGLRMKSATWRKRSTP